jgi:hypothetical protein
MLSLYGLQRRNDAASSRPRLCADPSGKYVYMLDSEWGLVKLGTGHLHTTAGRVYGQNLHLSMHADGWIACSSNRLAVYPHLIVTALSNLVSCFKLEARKTVQ